MPEMLARSLIASAMAAFLSVAPAAAQNFPNRPITILVPYSPGGPTDTAARVLGEHMAVTLGQNMVVENLTGGGGTIATGRAARATPDGYTLLLHQLALAANVTLLPNQPYDAEKELTGVGLVNFSPMVLVGRSTLPVETMAEMTAWMKLTGPDVKFAHAGSGTLAHLCAALLAQSLGIKVTMIPYRGGTPAVTDILAGHSDIYCSSPLTAMEQIKGKLIKAFAVTSPKRMATLPDVPSAVALGYKDLDIQFWQGLYVAAGTPKPVVERLNNALRLALADPKVVQSFTDTGMSAFPIDERTPEAATVKLRDEIKRWGEVIRANNIVAAP
jgi:tripartite-type tricarboxylate transporter receptor subunit TctC